MDEALKTLLKDSDNESIRRCAAGALSNIRSSAQYEARLRAESKRAVFRKGFRPRKWSPRSEASLREVLARRVKTDALEFSVRWRAATVIQACVRMRIQVRGSRPWLAGRRRSSVSSSCPTELAAGTPPAVEELERVARRLRDACDSSSETRAAVSDLAHLLADAQAEHCAHILDAVDSLGLPGLLVKLLAAGGAGGHTGLTRMGVSALVNVADIGGARIVKEAGGIEVFTPLLGSPDESLCYLAAAGIQNVLSSSDMMDDGDCMQRLVRGRVEAHLEALREAANDRIRRCAAGALANLDQSPAYQRLKSAMVVKEHYKEQAELDFREQSKNDGSGCAGSCDGSPRSVTTELALSAVFDVV